MLLAIKHKHSLRYDPFGIIYEFDAADVEPRRRRVFIWIAFLVIDPSTSSDALDHGNA